MNADLQALAEKLDRDPADPLTLQALADWLEERGAEGASLRALSVDGPTVLVFGYAGVRDRPAVEATAEKVAAFFEQRTGHPVCWVCLPTHVTLRQIKVDLAPPALARQNAELRRRLSDLARPDCG